MTEMDGDRTISFTEYINVINYKTQTFLPTIALRIGVMVTSPVFIRKPMYARRKHVLYIFQCSYTNFLQSSGFNSPMRSCLTFFFVSNYIDFAFGSVESFVER
jgi:hypothetical protein